MPNGDYSSVVRKLRPESHDPGEIVHIDGTVLGTHEGIIHFTIGQRRGLGIATGEPLYVVKLEPEQRRVTVGPKEALGSTELWARNINWLEEIMPNQGLEVDVKLRSTMAPVPATIYHSVENDRARIVLRMPQEAVTPGQACVAYQGTRVLGGGWIVRN